MLIAEGTSKRGTETKDTYSLVGFNKAFKKLKMFVIKRIFMTLQKRVRRIFKKRKYKII